MTLSHSLVKLTAAAVMKERRRLVWNLKVQAMIAMKHKTVSYARVYSVHDCVTDVLSPLQVLIVS